MPTGNHNFFHPAHPIDVVGYDDLSGGFREAGQFCVNREGLGTLKVDYTDARGNPDAPVALIMHGYRGQPNGANNKSFAHTLQGAGFATAQIGFAGYDHYGGTRALEAIDNATIASNIEDVQLIMKAIDPARKIVFVANSASINVAVPAATEKVSHILGVSPVPNITTLLQTGISALSLEMGKSGFLIDPRKGQEHMKVTKGFLEAGQPIDLLDAASISNGIVANPKLVAVRSRSDATLETYGAGDYVVKWLAASGEAGFNSITDMSVDGESHDLTREISDGFGAQVRLIAQDLGMPQNG